jgi:hypothetical protein
MFQDIKEIWVALKAMPRLQVDSFDWEDQAQKELSQLRQLYVAARHHQPWGERGEEYKSTALEAIKARGEKVKDLLDRFAGRRFCSFAGVWAAIGEAAKEANARKAEKFATGVTHGQHMTEDLFGSDLDLQIQAKEERLELLREIESEARAAFAPKAEEKKEEPSDWLSFFVFWMKSPELKETEPSSTGRAKAIGHLWKQRKVRLQQEAMEKKEASLKLASAPKEERLRMLKKISKKDNLVLLRAIVEEAERTALEDNGREEEPDDDEKFLAQLFEKHEAREDERPEARIVNFLIHRVKKMTYSGLTKARARLFDLKGKDELPYDLWVGGMLVVLEEMSKRESLARALREADPNGEWEYVPRLESSAGLLRKFVAMAQAMEVRMDHHTLMEASMGGGDPTSIEETLDLARAVRKLARANNYSFEEALGLWEQKEGVQ